MRNYFRVGGAAFALAAFVTLDVSFPRAFPVGVGASLEGLLRPAFDDPTLRWAVPTAAALIYLSVGLLGGLVGDCAFRLFRRTPPFRSGPGR